MAESTAPETTPHNPASGQEGATTGSDRLAELKSTVDALRNPAAQDQGTKDDAAHEPAAEKALSGKVRLPWEGDAVREMDVSELVTLAKRGLEADNIEAATKKLLGDDYPVVKQIGEAYDRLPKAQQQRLMAMLRGEQPTDAGGDDDDDFDPDDLLSEPSTNGKTGKNGTQLEQKIDFLMNYVQQESRTKQMQTLEQHVEGLIGKYPDLAGNPGAKSLAKRSVIQSFQLDGNQNLENLVATAAKDFHLLSQHERNVAVRKAGRVLPAGPEGDETKSFRPEKGLTADDLMRGNVKKQIMEDLRGRAGR